MTYGNERYAHKLVLWHGTNQDFDEFDGAMLGLHTYNSASNQAFFFASSPETAREYARSAAAKLIPNIMEHERILENILADAEDMLRRGNFKRHEELIIEAEEFEAEAVQAAPSGGKLLKCEISLSRPLEVSGRSRDVILDLGHVIAMARETGHDALILRNILDTPSGEGPIDDHLAVFDPAQIEIIDVISAETDAILPCHKIPKDICAAVSPFSRDEEDLIDDIVPA